MCKDIFLCRNILRIILVNIQMIRRQIGDDGDMRAPSHSHELERAQFQHSGILRLHASGLGQQRVADVPPQVDGFSRRPEQLRNDGGGGGLSVAAGNGQNGTGADLEENLHLAGQRAPPLHGGVELRQIRPHSRRAEDNVLRQVFQVVRPQPEAAALSHQLLRWSA